MERVAVFVDAGYLFAQGSAAIAGSKKPRTQIVLSDTAVLKELRVVAATKAAGTSLLRIYWYDGADSFKGPTAQHAQLAHSDDVKIRLGFLNSAGEQKGVDSLIVTDLVELARNRAICDAVVLSGDEDIRIGVQIAQNFGVRVHLLGIVPSRGSQSRHLQQEADTTTEWDKDTVAKFLSIRPAAVIAAAAAPKAPENGKPVAPKCAPKVEATAATEDICKELFATLLPEQLDAIKAFQRVKRGVPSEYDGRLLAAARTRLGRDLAPHEKRTMRQQFNRLVIATTPDVRQ
jgi:uncharacterized LabA/DUF88 family protein